MSSKVSVYVAYHRNDVEIVSNSVYHPIQVGRAISNVDLSGIIGDDTGDNISHLNPLYCETTATYWAWKNDTLSDYLGICHYRRFFATSQISLIDCLKNMVRYWLFKCRSFIGHGSQKVVWNVFHNPSSLKFENLIKEFETEIVQLTSKKNVDIFCLRPVKFPGQNIRTHFNILGGFHVELLERIVADRYPDFSFDLANLLKGNTMSYANMVIMARPMFDKYCSMLFDILELHRVDVQAQGWCKDPMGEKCYARMSGYMAELVTACFVKNIQRNNNSKVVELTAINKGV